MAVSDLKRYSPCDESEWRHPWEPVLKHFQSQSGGHVIYHYKTKDGRPLSTTLGMQAERISPRTSSKVMQDSSSFIYHCYEGKGHTLIETPSGEHHTFGWESKDTFAVPTWSKIQHFNESDTEEAYLVAVNDSPFLDLLGLRRP